MKPPIHAKSSGRGFRVETLGEMTEYMALCYYLQVFSDRIQRTCAVKCRCGLELRHLQQKRRRMSRSVAED